MYNLVIVDNEPYVLEQLTGMFEWEHLGYNLIESFSDSSLVLDFLLKNTVDVLLTDIRMPQYDGIDLARFCYENHLDTNVIFISAHSDFDYARLALQYSVKEYILKPFSYQKIHDVLKNVAFQISKARLQAPFSNNHSIMLHQHLFSDLLCGNIPNLIELKARLNTNSLSENLVDYSAAIIDLTLTEFDMYLNRIWQYGKDRLYNAVTLITSIRYHNTYFCLVMYVHNSIRIIAINLNEKNNLHLDVDSYCSVILRNLREFLNLEYRISITYFNSLGNLIETSPPLTAMKADIYNDLISQSVKYMEENYNKNISLNDLAKLVSFSRVYFSSYYKQHTNENYTDTLNKIRIRKAMELLRDPQIKASSVYEMVGYKSAPYFYKTFRKIANMTPAKYQMQAVNTNESI